MTKGIYTAASGMLTTTRELNAYSNNIANLSTAGYKSDRLIKTSFAESLALRKEGRSDLGDKTTIGSIARGVKAVENYTDYSQGALQQTGSPLDFAISGDGFFTMADNNGDAYYTRNGQFQINPDGYLINGLGHNVLGSDGAPVYVGRSDFTVDTGGNIYDAEGGFLGTLGIYNPAEPHLLYKDGEGMLRVMADHTPDTSGTPAGAVIQGSTEASNVDLAQHMSALLSTSRMYQALSQVVKNYDSLLSKSISEVGRI